MEIEIEQYFSQKVKFCITKLKLSLKVQTPTLKVCRKEFTTIS